MCLRAIADVAYQRQLDMVCGGSFLEKYPTLRQVLGVWWAHEYFVEFDGTDFCAVTHHTDAPTKRQGIQISAPKRREKMSRSISEGLMG